MRGGQARDLREPQVAVAVGEAVAGQLPRLAEVGAPPDRRRRATRSPRRRRSRPRPGRGRRGRSATPRSRGRGCSSRDDPDRSPARSSPCGCRPAGRSWASVHLRSSVAQSLASQTPRGSENHRSRPATVARLRRHAPGAWSRGCRRCACREHHNRRVEASSRGVTESTLDRAHARQRSHHGSRTSHHLPARTVVRDIDDWLGLVSPSHHGMYVNDDEGGLTGHDDGS